MRTRAFLGLTLLLAGAVAASASALWDTVSNPFDAEMTADLDYYDQQRFATVRPLLPASGTIGYAEDDPPRSNVGPILRFAQYVLTPVVLREHDEEPVILVNGRPEAVPSFEPSHRRTLRHDAGNGVRLFGPGRP